MLSGKIDYDVLLFTGSLKSTPCENLGGACINYDVCPGLRQMPEVSGCKNQLQVCCYVWSISDNRGQRDHGKGNLMFHWRRLAQNRKNSEENLLGNRNKKRGESQYQEFIHKADICLLNHLITSIKKNSVEKQ